MPFTQPPGNPATEACGRIITRENNLLFGNPAPSATAPLTLIADLYLNGGTYLGSFENGVDQGYAWVTGAADPYTIAGDGSASSTLQHTHTYARVIWKFSYSGDIPLSATVLVDSEIPNDGTGGLIITARTAGVWISADNGNVWWNIYNTRPWPRVISEFVLPEGTNPDDVMVMAFIDAHDDMVHYIHSKPQMAMTFESVTGSGAGQIFPTGQNG